MRIYQPGNEHTFMPPLFRKQSVVGTPDFHSVMLKWERQRDFVAEDNDSARPSFTVRFCENQVSQPARTFRLLSLPEQGCPEVILQGLNDTQNKPVHTGESA